jgi:hypothetical protein
MRLSVSVVYAIRISFNFFKIYLILLQSVLGSRHSVVGIATSYGLEGPGIESRWGEIFRIYPDRPRGPPSLLYNGYRVFPGGKGGRGVMLTTHPLLVPRLRKNWAIPPLTLWVLLGLLRGSLYKVFLFGGKLFLLRYEAASMSSSFRITTFRGNDVFHLEGSQCYVSCRINFHLGWQTTGVFIA